jgi:hypothetical protein
MQDDAEHRECTFQPTTSNNTGQYSPRKPINSANKWDELYQAAERKRGGRDRNQDEIEYERE